MAPSFIPIEQLRTKFYQKENSSKTFLDLSEEQLLLLSKKVYRMQEKMEDNNQSIKINRMSNLERYQRILLYLTNPHIHLE